MFIFAHRGAKGTHPENTMSAFVEAVEVGAPGIELDVHLTRDGEVVVIHDETLQRTTTGSGNVKDHDYKVLSNLDAGVKFREGFVAERIPTLRDVLAMIATTSLILNIELKNDIFRYEGMEEKVIALVKEYQLEEQVIFSSFNHESIALLQQLVPTWEMGLLYDDYSGDVVEDALEKDVKAIHLNKKYIRQELVEKAHKNGLIVRVYTVNKEKEMQKMNEYGVDAIFTDFPKQGLQAKKS